jgi:hypothetical protein
MKSEGNIENAIEEAIVAPQISYGVLILLLCIRIVDTVSPWYSFLAGRAVPQRASACPLGFLCLFCSVCKSASIRHRPSDDDEVSPVVELNSHVGHLIGSPPAGRRPEEAHRDHRRPQPAAVATVSRPQARYSPKWRQYLIRTDARRQPASGKAAAPPAVTPVAACK